MQIPSPLLLSLALLPIFSASAGAQLPMPPAAATLPTQVPALVAYSGVALTSEGKVLSGDHPATFLIYKDQQSGEPLFTETQTITLDQAGHYKVQLGAANPNGLPSDLFSTGEARWLEIQIAGQQPEPRILLASVPYALKAADAATLGGLPASAFALAANNTAIANATTATIGPDATSTVTTTGGTANTIAKFSGTSTIVNSLIYDNGTDVGIGTTSPSATLTVDGTMAIDGASTLNGTVTLPAQGTATASKAYSSQAFKLYTSAYNSSSKAVVPPRFQLMAEVTGNDTASPSATLNLLASPNANAPAETGFYFNTNGTIHFASGQTFPGTGAGTITGVTAGTGLTGGGASGKVTLNVNTAQIASLAGNNTFTGSNVFVPSIYENTDVNIDNTNSNPGNISPGLRFGSASGEGMSSKRTSGGNQYGLDFYTGYASRMSITAAGLVGIGLANPTFQLQVQATAMNEAFKAQGVYIPGSGYHYGTDGIVGQGAYTDGSSGGTAGAGALLYGGDADTAGDANYGLYAIGGFGDDGSGETLSAKFDGNIQVNGDTYSVVHASKIDHPLDPANKYLTHAAVQSSELMNIYTGNVTTDQLGLATVQLPEWFEAENADFRYQLTVLDERFAQAVVSKKIQNHRFTIHTNASNVEVSWQITAVRQDAYAKAHPLVVEETKSARQRGFYEHPELFGQPREKQMEWAIHPKMMQRMQASRETQASRATAAGSTAVRKSPSAPRQIATATTAATPASAAP